MKFLLFPAVALVLAATSALAPARAQDANPILVELRPRLQDALRKQVPDATWELKGNELTASFKTRTFTIYSLSPQGDVAAQAHQEIGPQDGGFVLRVRVFSALPAFAAQVPRSTRQAYWRTYLTRYNLRGDGEIIPLLPQPTAPEEVMVRERLEFTDISQASYALLYKLQDAGLLKVARAGIRNAPPLTRYEAAVELAKLQDRIPDLTKNRALRLKALENATKDAGKTLSQDELAALDNALRELQAEFDNELTRLKFALNNGPALRAIEPRVVGAPPQPPPTSVRAGTRYLVVTLSESLTSYVINTNSVLQVVEQLAREKNRIADDK